MSVISSAKSKSHRCSSPDHVMSPALLSVVLSTQAIAIANSRLHYYYYLLFSISR